MPYLNLMTLEAPQRSYDLGEVYNALRFMPIASGAVSAFGRALQSARVKYSRIGPGTFALCRAQLNAQVLRIPRRPER